jgi:hypothetical protein
MCQFLVTDLAGNSSQIVTLEQAADIAQLDPDDILWALEEEGLCETDQHIVVEYVEPAIARG